MFDFKKITFKGAAAAGTVMFALSLSVSAFSDARAADVRANRAEHLRFFGYYLFLQPPNLDEQRDRLADLRRIADHANLVKLNAALPRDRAGLAELVRILEAARDLQLKVLLAYPLYYSDLAGDGAVGQGKGRITTLRAATRALSASSHSPGTVFLTAIII